MNILNLNDYVLVQLTKDGKEAYMEYVQKMETDINASQHLKNPFVYQVIKPDIRGWYKFQLWDVMRIFGDRCEVTLPQLFTKNCIRF